MIILFTVRCEIYVHTSHIQGWGVDVKRALIYFKVDLLRPSSQFPVDYTGFKTDRNKHWAEFREELWSTLSWEQRRFCLPALDKPLLT